ncbi:MAG: hypothetical protein M1837_006601 [Sclerophora amabilis]|nr:MAG: hypothetical protein M1837_006601 [Sclerophora amabilis]
MDGGARRKLLITFDAFGTLFVPRLPIARQYGDVAARHGLPRFDEHELEQSFRRAFKQESKLHPNYGKASGMKAPEWWANIIKETFRPFTSQQSNDLPDGLIRDLLTRFSSSAGYELCSDVLPLFQAIRETKRQSPFRRTPFWPWDLTIVGVVTNSDDRVPSILKSLGLDVGMRTVENSKQMRHGDLEKDISFTVMSYDLGVEKPDPRMLVAAEQLMYDALICEDPLQKGKNVDIERKARLENFKYVHVGDDRKDVETAQNASWSSVQVVRDGVSASPQISTHNHTHPNIKSDQGWSGANSIVPNLEQIGFWKPN